MVLLANCIAALITQLLTDILQMARRADCRGALDMVLSYLLKVYTTNQTQTSSVKIYCLIFTPWEFQRNLLDRTAVRIITVGICT